MTKVTVTNLTIVSSEEPEDSEFPNLVGICRGEYEGCELSLVGWGTDLNEAMADLLHGETQQTRMKTTKFSANKDAQYLHLRHLPSDYAIRLSNEALEDIKKVHEAKFTDGGLLGVISTQFGRGGVRLTSADTEEIKQHLHKLTK